MMLHCSKLIIYFVHQTGAEGHRIAHPAICPCAQAYIMYRNNLKYKGALTGCTGINMCAPGSQIVHTTGCRVHS